MAAAILPIFALALLPLGAAARGGAHSGGSHASSASRSGASHSVKGYTRKNGTYVAAHRATNADGSKSNNWSHKGNVNPYTGKPGSKND